MLIDREKLERLAQALNSKSNASIKNESQRALSAETNLQDSIDEVRDMFGGKSIEYITQEQYNQLSDEEKNNPAKAYFIIDAEDLSHKHVNKDFLDGLSPELFEAKQDKADERLTTQDKTITGAINELDDSIDRVDILTQGLMMNVQDLTNNKADKIYYNIKEHEAGVEMTKEVTTEFLDTYRFVTEEEKELWNNMDALTLNGYSLWVGTTAELEAIGQKDPNTLYFEIDDGTDEEVVQVDVVNGVLTLTTDKYQKTNMVNGAQIVLPEVNRFTEIHLYFKSDENMNLNFPDNARWRLDANIEEGKSYEIVCTYNTIEWLINVIVYS